MPPPSDPGLERVLGAFGISPDALLGFGGEARVYALGPDRVLRVSHGFVDPEAIARRFALVDELRRGGAPFVLPEVLEAGEVGGRTYTIEPRMPGLPVSALLETAEGVERRELIERHLSASAALGGLALTPRGWFGELLADPPIRAATWQRFLVQRAEASLAIGGAEFAEVDAVALAADLPEPDASTFVHLDAFAGNMLADASGITAVIDIGPASLAGDARLDPLASAVYLLAPQITPQGRPGDSEVVHGWLRDAGLEPWYEPARRWLAAYWTFAVDDPKVLAWCRSVLFPG